MLDNARLQVRIDTETFAAAVSSPGRYSCGPLEIDLQFESTGFSWSFAVAGDRVVEVESVALIWDAGPAGNRVTVFSNGHQSWSRAGRAVLGETEDPSRAPGSIDLARAIYHADPSVVRAGELRSEMVAVIDFGGAEPLTCLGFDQASEHDATFRVLRVDDRIEVTAEAYLGGARVEEGSERHLHPVTISQGDSAPLLLEDWAGHAGRAGGALTGRRYQIGWCSWYQYFHDLSERDLFENLTNSKDWPFEIFQIDDGYQTHIGDWLSSNDRFPSDLDVLASRITGSGLLPGIWIAPFLASPESNLARGNPELLASTIGAEAPLVGMVNPGWGGITYVLDTTKPETIAHLEKVAADLVSAGFSYIKIDFAFAPSIPGRYSDPTLTPAQRVRAGLQAIRRGAGADTFLLGCGCPLGPAVGIVEGMRIGPDVAPYWEPPADQFAPPGYELEAPSTKNAWRNTLARSYMHRRLWLNDPDCIMLRLTQTQLSPEAVRDWALAVGMSGGMALVSDDLSLIDRKGRALFEEVIEIGRRSDELAVKGLMRGTNTQSIRTEAIALGEIEKSSLSPSTLI